MCFFFRNAANDGSDEVDGAASGRKRDKVKDFFKFIFGDKFPINRNEEITFLNECLSDLKSQ